ncbi:MAG TPA: protease pro-enzyme activation domain-containing protein [Candidatus Binataceae bacterium]|nr:protease pro-enzyme activation domain-containing protein [Candidatus Binataceae bacterium]
MRADKLVICAIAVALCVVAGSARTDAQTVPLRGTVSPLALKLPTYGDLPATQTLPLQIWFKSRNQEQLNALLASQQDPRSPQYHKWLTPQEYAGRFGVTQPEFDQVSNWLKSEGFQVTGGSPLDGYVKFSGSTLTISRAFGTSVSKFSPDGSRFGILNEPRIPSQYEGVVGTITGLDNLHAAKALPASSMAHPVTRPDSRLQK